VVPYTELHARSAFSFLRGASLPEALVERAAALDQASVAICDHMGFAGSARAHQTATDLGIRALVGTTLDMSAIARRATAEVPSIKGQGPNPTHLPVLCATRTGYSALCQSLTRSRSGNRSEAEMDGVKLRSAGSNSPARPGRHSPQGDGGSAALPLWTLALNTWHFEPGSLIALTGDRDGPLCQALLHHNPGAALTAARSLIDTFGRENIYIQLVRHGLRDEPRLHRQLIDLARHLRLPLLATNSPLHATRADRPLADAFTCLRHHTTLDQAGSLLAPNGARHLASAASMRQRFADIPEALSNTQRLAERLEFTLENLGYRFPSSRDPDGRLLPPDEERRLLRELTFQNAGSRFPKLNKKVRRQLDHELELIGRLGFSGYFLIVHDLVLFARSRGILCQGRGSAANSAVCFALGITAVDPVNGGLLFERFLSENRRTWPDIDLDLPSGDQRETVIRYVFEKYAPHGAAMTANVITYRSRSAFREMSKVLGFPPSVADRFSATRSSPHPGEPRDSPPPSQIKSRAERDRLEHSDSPAGGRPEGRINHQSSIINHSSFEQAGIPPSHPRFHSLCHLYQSVLKLPRHLGQHPGGMVICDEGLDHIVPLQPAAMPGRTILQWDKDDCEDLGIVKIDLLGLGMLAAIEDALHTCEIRGRPIDLAKIPKDDPAVFDLLCRADTIGTFQVESRAQMATLPIMRPKTFYDLAIEVAIIRPGPIVGDLVHPYLNRRNGREPVDHIHPSLEPVLQRTLGVPLFQEQVLKMAMILAGFDGNEADELRRAMGFKRSDERMENITAKLRERMAAKRIAPDVQEKIVQSIGSFALYGFPESHAISFALIAYASCWLKVHRPAEFYAGLISCQPMGFYSVNTLIQDAKRHGIRIRPVSCVHSSWKTIVLDDSAIRLGLHRLKGLSQKTGDRLLAARDHQAFISLEDFLRRTDPTKKERRLLATSGALNDLPQVTHRRQALWQAELPLHDDLLGGTPNSKLQTPISKIPILPMQPPERLAADLAAQGATTGPHPMALWRAQFSIPSDQFSARAAEEPANYSQPTLKTDHCKLANSHRARELHSLPHGTPVAVCGMVICRQRPGTAKGHCFISLEDETGIANLFVPRDTFHKFRLLITTHSFLLVRGRLQISEGNQPTVYTTHLEILPGIDETLAATSHDFH